MAEGTEYAEKLLIVCAVCRRVRDDEGRWIAPDKLPASPHQKTSHAICPECGREKYPRYAERRRYPREFIQVFVEVRTSLDDGSVFAVDGVTVNLSRGGMLALLHEGGPIGPDSPCEVRFKDPGDIVAPELTTGIVIRSGPRGPDYEVAIDFPAPLDLLLTPTL